MIIPLSGKSGYVRWFQNQLTHIIPIYSWDFTATKQLTQYRTSASFNFPVGFDGVKRETIIIKGADFFPSFLNVAFEQNVIEFRLGFSGKSIHCFAALDFFQLDWNYGVVNGPVFMWTASFTGVVEDKEFANDVAFLSDDEPYCFPTTCDLLIVRNGIEVQHVAQASIKVSQQRPYFVTSISNNHPKAELGPLNTDAALIVEGDFDNWLTFLNNPLKHLYTFSIKSQYPAQPDLYSIANMKVNNISNLISNVQTGALVSAAISLTGISLLVDN